MPRKIYNTKFREQGWTLDLDYSEFVYIIEENLFVSYLDIFVNLVYLGDISINLNIMSFAIQTDSYLATFLKP